MTLRQAHGEWAASALVGRHMSMLCKGFSMLHRSMAPQVIEVVFDIMSPLLQVAAMGGGPAVGQAARRPGRLQNEGCAAHGRQRQAAPPAGERR